MRGFLFLTLAVLIAAIPTKVQGACVEDTVRIEKLDSVVIYASRAGKSTPVTYTLISKKELKESNPIFSIPMSLSLQPSVVSVTEGGTGLGYSKMTIRGSKSSQINVTINGVALNNPESQEVFWVNIPSLGNMLSSIQLQRGIGISTNGTGAFGASINMSTSSVALKPYASADLSAGSYNTFMATGSAGTGKMKSGLYFDFTYSRNYTDGYIRNAFANVQSLLANVGWMNENNSLKLTYLMGDQHTGITWNGISLDQYEKDRRYNPAGEYYDQYGNVRYYDNESDNYTQHFVMLNYTHQFNSKLAWSTSVNYTRGDGYYENYKTGKESTDYGFNELFEGDFIIRKAMANNFYLINSDLKYKTSKLDLTAGISLSLYDGNHFGKVLWSDILGQESGYDYENHYWYANTGLKKEASAFIRGEYTPVNWFTAFADIQYRGVGLDMNGPDDDGAPLDYNKVWNFFNPKAGVTFNFAEGHKAFLSGAIGHREPGRSDIKEVIISRNLGEETKELKPEMMLDIEIGYSYESEKVAASANIYLMEYWDMLLETGKLSDVGYAIKENVGRGFRRGIELAAAWKPLKWLTIDANTTLSLNKINDFKGYFDRINSSWEYLPGQQEIDFGQTDMLMSPSVIGMLQFSFKPFKKTTISINGKYVSKQYIDNTSSDLRAIPEYYVVNLMASHSFNLPTGVIELSGYINNLTNHLFYADGWTYNVYDTDSGKIVSDIGIFPQAPINFMLKLSYKF
ncbi:MAG: TonB-dependent receptor [Bacteroidales bacterium]|nr:TonB-dependent receptor [Bacteroidales bacterium]